MPKESNHVPDRKFRLSALELLLLMVIVIGLAFMIRAVAAPDMVADSRLSVAVSQLEQRMTEISDRLNLEEAASGSSGEKNKPESRSQLTERLNRLEQKVEGLERRLDQEGRASKDDDVTFIRDTPRKKAISE
ncbi:MAG: hypothetical protein HY788_01435 [Deltaproteobacteria bacterium]|nr:hypothetical protein [Deltaproteobacteria bacterium]